MKSDNCNTNDLKDITRYVDLKAYIGKVHKNGEDMVILHIADPENRFNIGFSLGADFSEKVMKHFTKDGKPC